MFDFDEQQARTDALSFAIAISKVGTSPTTIINKAQKFYGFILRKEAELYLLNMEKNKAD